MLNLHQNQENRSQSKTAVTELDDGASNSRPTGRNDRLLMICASARDARELTRVENVRGVGISYHKYASAELESSLADDPTSSDLHDVRDEIDVLIKRCELEKVSAVASTDDYPGSALAAIISDHFGMSGVRPAASLICQHKFHSRNIQREAAPEAVPNFYVLDVRPEVTLPPQLTFPVFIKPVKSYLSLGSQVVSSVKELSHIRQEWLGKSAFFEIFDSLLQSYTPYSIDYQFLLAEDCLYGHQVTLDGYAYNGEIYALGVVDSIMYPGTLAFKRFEYPSALSAEVQSRMAAISESVMKHLGYGKGQFNIEFMYDADTDRLAIIEINPRMSSQFADLYEKVDGINGYEVMVDLARGIRPRRAKSAGPHTRAASCVLRTFRNQRVLQLPTADELEKVNRDHPDVRIEILAEAGMMLSQQLQDGRSYRYGLLNIGGRDREDIQAIFDECMRRLTFVLEPV
jgi:biotin carboxylase